MTHETGCIEFYDSCCSDHYRGYLKSLAGYFIRWHAEEVERESHLLKPDRLEMLKAIQWDILYHEDGPKKPPQQGDANFEDCGVYTLMAMKHLIIQKPLLYGPKQGSIYCDHLRQQMALELATGRLLPPDMWAGIK